MEIIGNDHFSIGVPIKADPEFKAMLFAAAITHIDGNKSIDYIYRRYGKEYLEAFDDDKRCPSGSLKELVLHVGKTAEGLAKRLSSGTFTSQQPTGCIYAVNVLIRMQSTFHAISQLILGGLALEAEAVIRQGIEQCAWSLAVKGLDDVHDVNKTSPTKSVSRLKQSFPGAGHIYGLLSDSAHASPSSQSRFIERDGDQVAIAIRSTDHCRQALLYLVMLLDTYANIAESIINHMGVPTPTFEPPVQPHDYNTINRYTALFNDADLVRYSTWRGA
ncbi:hypothetical protein [Rhodanobacter sp. B05]|uniref:hypothetical protein n=1 Tax=Rhodanobacter sp. B05 TaxID=1945859 RepID=UPI001115A110|nr:hypothetical protein [Rhodanobacter sp. B05]